MNIQEVLNRHNSKSNKAKEDYDNLIQNINKETAKALDELSLSEFESLSLDRLYRLLNVAYWYSEKRVDEVIEIVERKKLEVRKKEGFVLYPELNDKINLSNELKMKIEDRFKEALNLKKSINKEFLLQVKLDNDEVKNNEIWKDIINKLIETNNASVVYSIKCLNEECPHAIVKFKGRTVMWAKLIINNFDKYKETKETKYKYKAYGDLSQFVELPDEFFCFECDTEFSLEDIYDELKNIEENPSIYILEPYKFSNKEFYPINKEKIKTIK